MARVTIFLITVALIAGMMGCDGNRESYTVTITSTPGGSVVDPGEGTFTYYAGTEINLVAEADEGYQFVCWTGGLLHFADRRAPATTIVIDNNYSISANFAVPTLVLDWYDLNAITDDLYGVYILMNDLTCTTPGYEELAGPTANGGKGWQPIGSTNETQFEFHGTLDGGGHEICDLFINRPDEYDVGLFGMVYFCGGITNLGVVNATVTGYMWVGGLVGNSVGIVANCYSACSVNGTDHVGGLVGANGQEGTVSNSYSIGNVTGDNRVGGLVGVNVGIVSDCHSISSLISGEGNAGGLVGVNSKGTISNSYSTGSVTGMTAGGLVGVNLVAWYYEGTTWNYEGTISNSYSTGSVTGEIVGGLVGENQEDTVETVKKSFWNIETSGQATSAGGTGKTTTEMQDISTFSSAGWEIIDVANFSTRDPSHIWNIVDDVTYPFLSWQS
jgi:hypothetical protein